MLEMIKFVKTQNIFHALYLKIQNAKYWYVLHIVLCARNTFYILPLVCIERFQAFYQYVLFSEFRQRNEWGNVFSILKIRKQGCGNGSEVQRVLNMQRVCDLLYIAVNKQTNKIKNKKI